MEMVKGSILDPFAVTATLTLLQVVGHIPVPHIVPPPPKKNKKPQNRGHLLRLLEGRGGRQDKEMLWKRARN